jgi:protein phosphatase
MATSADDSTPAARASSLSAPRPPAPEPPPAPGRDDDPERPRRHPVRTAVLLVVLLGLLGAGVWGGWTWTQRQYYVGATEDGQLAVFQGVPGQIAGLNLSSVHSTSGTELTDLTAAAQEQVKQGIQAKDQPDAARRLAELTSDDPANPNLKPICPPPLPTTDPTGTPIAPPPGSATATGTPPPGPTSPGGVATPANTPDAPPSDPVPPAPDPVGCRSTE